jgi:hypothetical protein
LAHCLCANNVGMGFYVPRMLTLAFPTYPGPVMILLEFLLFAFQFSQDLLCLRLVLHKCPPVKPSGLCTFNLVACQEPLSGSTHLCIWEFLTFYQRAPNHCFSLCFDLKSCKRFVNISLMYGYFSLKFCSLIEPIPLFRMSLRSCLSLYWLCLTLAWNVCLISNVFRDFLHN